MHILINSIWKGWLEKEKSIDIIYYQDYNVSEYRIVTLWGFTYMCFWIACLRSFEEFFVYKELVLC